MGSLWSLRERELPERVATRLAPFINAYRPHSDAPSRKELEDAGFERVETESFVDILEECYFETHGYYPDDNPALNDN